MPSSSNVMTAAMKSSGGNVHVVAPVKAMAQTNIRGGGGGGGSGGGQIARASPLRRRRLSRGLIAAGNRGTTGSISVGNNTDGNAGNGPQLSRSGDENNNITSSSSATSDGGALGGKGQLLSSPGRRPGAVAGPSSSETGNANNAASDDSANPMITLPKPNYSGRLAVACVQNALNMGVITKFSLCPQGKARKNLVTATKAARERREWKSSALLQKRDGAHDRAQEIFLQNPTTAEEEYSSGDDDDFEGSIDDDEDVVNNNANNPLHNSEPFFIPTGTDAASMGLQGGQVPGMTAGKLPFNYRKVRYFDAVTAADRAVVRQFLREEIKNAKKLRSKAISNHLKKAQMRERERMERESAVGNADSTTRKPPNPLSEDVEGGGSNTVDLKSEQTALATALSRFPHELTPTLSAALLIESLAMNHHESVEGMAKCYDGIVSAGTALLDLANDRDSSNGTVATNHGGKQKLTASEIMGALAPLLITTLEQPSGEAIVELSRLRKFCGTRRYQRRFVQRIAPHLVRPPDAATWCLRHQSDIEPIIAAVEMILDNATEVFSAGWFERGRNMLKDTRRAETLRTAASQLRRLNSPSLVDGVAGGGGGGLLVGLSSAPGSQVHRRASVGKKEGGHSITNNALAEWEVVAVDKSIRQSIMDVFSRDWGRISTLNLSPKESETQFGGSRHSRRGISTAKSKEWNDAASTGSGTGGSATSQVSGFTPASSLTKSPRALSKLPLSPRNAANVTPLPSADALASTFGPSFESQNVVAEDAEMSTSPTEQSLPPAPLSPRRDSSLRPSTPKTPPTHYHEVRSDDRISMPNFQDQSPQHASPSRASLTAPISPQSSVGNASTSSIGTMRSTANSQMGTTREQYRALTSTAAERKRTVAACRALRAQITQFEDAFIQMHGRPPKGAAERAPLASTYMQYREWKRAIRADAACRIQALCRGARARLMLMRSEDRRISGFVSLRAASAVAVAAKSPSSKPPNHLSIPLDMVGDDVDSALTRTRLETRTGQRGDDSVEVEMVPVIPSVSPNWRNRPQRNQQPPGGSSPSASLQQSPKSSSSRSRSSLPDVSIMSLAELQQRKRELKQQLKLYDMNFHAQHGRMPEKREKEPIRHLYESYNAYKNQISTIEKGEAQPGPGTAAFRGVNTDTPADVSPKNASPTFGSGNTSPSQGQFKRLSSGGASETTDANSSVNSLAVSSNEEGPGSVGTSEVASQDLASLKQEKATLHQMLRSYEKDFFKQHKRQVSSFADIRPVANQYRRYKEIKKAIAQKSSS